MELCHLPHILMLKSLPPVSQNVTLVGPSIVADVINEDDEVMLG